MTLQDVRGMMFGREGLRGEGTLQGKEITILYGNGKRK